MTPYDLASRFMGEVRERPGNVDDPFIVWCLSLCRLFDVHDETPWCSAFVNAILWMLRLPRSGSAAARSNLKIGTEKRLEEAEEGFDIVIVKSSPLDPGPDVTVNMRGHVGFYAGHDDTHVWILGGNQSNSVTIERFPRSLILGVRRI